MTDESFEDHVKKVFDANCEEEFEESLREAQEVSLKNFGKRIRFYAPSFMYYKTSYYRSFPTDFPTISVTGKSCALKCKHCGQLKRKGALGCLISGGCLPDGSVPLGKFIDVIEKAKRKLGLTVIVHTGIIDFYTAKRLRNAGVDAALIDVIGSDETIREIYRLNVTVKAYEDSLRSLHEAGIAFVPHVIAGLHYGKLKGELHALKMISKYQPSALVIIAFMPIHGTEMESVAPPKPMDIAKVMVAARLMFSKTPLALGCMRPKGKHRIETDILAIKAGVNAIAFPTEEAIKTAERLGYEISFSSVCCSQVYSDFMIRTF